MFVSVNSAFTTPGVSLDPNVFTVQISAKSFFMPLLSHFFPTLHFEPSFWSLEQILQIVILNYSLGINITSQTTPIWEILIFHSTELLFLQSVTDEIIE